MSGRLDGGKAFIMALVAFFFVDSFHFFLGFFWLGFIADLIGLLVFFPWLKSQGIGMFSGMAMSKSWSTIIITALPFTFFIPTWTVYIISIWWTHRNSPLLENEPESGDIMY